MTDLQPDDIKTLGGIAALLFLGARATLTASTARRSRRDRKRPTEDQRVAAASKYWDENVRELVQTWRDQAKQVKAELVDVRRELAAAVSARAGAEAQRDRALAAADHLAVTLQAAEQRYREAERRIDELERENAELRSRLGLPPA